MDDCAQSTYLILSSSSQVLGGNPMLCFSVTDFPGLPATTVLYPCCDEAQTSGSRAQHSPLLPCAHGWYLLTCHDAAKVQEQHLLPWQGQCTLSSPSPTPSFSSILGSASYPNSPFPIPGLSSPLLNQGSCCRQCHLCSAPRSSGEPETESFWERDEEWSQGREWAEEKGRRG